MPVPTPSWAVRNGLHAEDLDADGRENRVVQEAVTLAGSTATTAFPFVEETLTVLVDGLDQTMGLSAVDGAAQTFELGFTPTATEAVFATYLKQR